MTCRASDCPGLAHRAGLIPAVTDELRSAGALLAAALDLTGDEGGQIVYSDLDGIRRLVLDLWPTGTCPDCMADALALLAVVAAGLVPDEDRPDAVDRNRRHLSTLAARPT